LQTATSFLPAIAAPAARRGKIRLWLVAAALLPLTLGATENGATTFPNGGEDFLVAAMPPPGTYGWLTYSRYDADRLAGNSRTVPPSSFDFPASRSAS